jgi:hypothetical protein
MSQKSSDKEAEGEENENKGESEKNAVKAAKILELQASGVACV